MPPKKKVPKGKPSAPKMCCALCSNEVETDEVATCVECKRSAHRYCAGVPLDEFESAGGSYTCLSCLKRLHETEMADMSDCITALEAEIVELREALKEAIKDAPKMVEGKDSKQVTSRNSSVTWSTVVSRRRKNKEKNVSTLSKCPSRNSDSDSRVTVAKVRRPKSAVEGKRKVWGTLRSTTATAVKNTIKAITKIDGLDVKRKYHVKNTRQGASTGPKIQVSKWWFVITGEEPTLQSLMENWSAVKYQTNWSLEPVLSFCDSELATIQTDNGEQVISQSTPEQILLKWQQMVLTLLWIY